MSHNLKTPEARTDLPSREVVDLRMRLFHLERKVAALYGDILGRDVADDEFESRRDRLTRDLRSLWWEGERLARRIRRGKVRNPVSEAAHLLVGVTLLEYVRQGRH
ncbi:hypothetical protein SAMN06265795_11495 [Noviherbaspirillum humi]|uniref:Uncharacterized protein n=1 Tax=Noviherbaspirillum humi TaxID=1688639 RepID=A0A239K2V4_9BURK|nr:hypothetical protein [Noviherbaspirillum humi]SNT12012.1 hypothetical protein SAMN06265795_11495 [Noviherbaspirillum humi]